MGNRSIEGHHVKRSINERRYGETALSMLTIAEWRARTDPVRPGNVNDLPAGTFVCLLTSGGCYSEFVVTETVGVSPSPLKITFTTWAANP